MGRKRSAALTPRQREWLSHLRACARRGETVRGYARRHGFSEHGMYQAAKDLRRRGVELPTRSSGRGQPQKPSAPTPAFVRVSPAISASSPFGSGAWRVRLPNGVVIEGSERPESGWLEALARL